MPLKFFILFLSIFLFTTPLKSVYAKDLPDLKITSLRFHKGLVTIKVKNQGNTPVDLSKKNNLSFAWKDINGKVIGKAEQKVLGVTSEVPKLLSPNGSIRFKYSLNPPKTAYTLLAAIDSEGGEGGGSTQQEPIGTPDKPDLIVENVTIERGNEGSIFINISSKNIGKSSSLIVGGKRVQAMYEWLDEAGNSIHKNAFTISTTSLGQNQSTQDTINTGLPDNVRKIRVSVDTSNRQGESNLLSEGREDNNQLTQDTPKFPDLIIGNVSFDADGDKPIVTINNIGKGQAKLRTTNSQSMQLQMKWYDQSGRMIGDATKTLSTLGITQTNLQSNSSITVTDSDPAPVGAVEFYAKIDSSNQELEWFESNNEKRLSSPGASLIKPEDRPDLTVSNVEVKKAGEGILLTSTLINIGKSSSLIVGGKRVQAMYEWLDEAGNSIHKNAFTISTTSLGQNQSTSETINTGLPDRVRKIRVSVDASNRPEESNLLAEAREDNNQLTVDAAKFPDLVVGGIGLAGQTVSYSISNQGEEAFNGTVNISYSFLRKNGLAVNRDLGEEQINLSPGGGTGKTFSVEPPNDAAILKVTATTDVTEVTTDNNSAEYLIPLKDLNGASLAKLDGIVAANNIASNIESQVSLEGEATPAAAPQTPQGAVTGPLPGELPYVFKDAGRGIQSVFTFDPVKKIGLKQKFAKEKILEANALADQGKTEKAADHLSSYEGDIKDAKDLTDQLSKKKPEVVDKIAQIALEDQIRHQVIVGKIEKEAPLNKLDDVKETREKLLTHIGETIETVNDKDKVQIAIKEGLIEGGSPFGGVWNLEVLKSVEKKAPETVKDVIEQVKADEIEQLNTTLTQLPEDQQSLLAGYVGGAGGEETGYLKVFDDLKFSGLNEEVKDDVFQAKTQVVADVKDRMGQADDAINVISDLGSGSIEDLRILNDIEDIIDPKFTEEVAEIKKEATVQFAESVEGFDEGAKTQFIEDTTIAYADIEQVALYQDLQVSLLEDQKEIASKLEDSMEGYVREQLTETKGAEYDEFLAMFAGDDPDDLLVMKAFGANLGGEFGEILIDEQLDLYQEQFSYFDEGDYSELYEEYRDWFLEDEEVGSAIQEEDQGFYSNIEEDIYNPCPSEEDDSNVRGISQLQGSGSSQFGSGDPCDSAESSRGAGSQTFDGGSEDSGAIEGDGAGLGGPDGYGADTPSGPQPEPESSSNETCPDEYDPVCGVNGQTYRNECEANKEEVPVAFYGPCDESDLEESRYEY